MDVLTFIKFECSSLQKFDLRMKQGHFLMTKFNHLLPRDRTTLAKSHVPTLNLVTFLSSFPDYISRNEQNATQNRDYPIVLRSPLKATKKAVAFVKDNLQNKFNYSSLDFSTPSINAKSNTHNRINARISGNIILLDFLKILKKYGKKIFNIETPLGSLETLKNRGKLLRTLMNNCSGDSALN